MTVSLPPRQTGPQSHSKAREILDGAPWHRIDPTTIKIEDSNPCEKGGQGTIFVGTTIPPEKIPTWIPEDFLKWFFEKKLAIKKYEWNREDTEASAEFLNSFVNELSIMASLSHPNIIEFFGFVEDMEKGDAWIVLSWEPNGNVREFLASGEWDIPERISLIQDVANGVDYLHTRQPPICHGDLKSLNILVNSSYHAVITNFGSARTKGSANATAEARDREPPSQMNIDNVVRESPKIKFDQSTLELTLTEAGYSLRWTAPEVLRDGPGAQDLPSDMWALGWICREIFTGEIPFEEVRVDSLVISTVIKGNLPAIRQEVDLSQVIGLRSLIMDCWMPNPVKRIDASTFQQKVRYMPSTTPSAERRDGAKVRSVVLLYELGTMYRLQDNWAVAESYYQSAIEVANQTKDDWAKANALYGIGETYRAQSRNREAMDVLWESHGIQSRIGNDLGAANALLSLGGIYWAQSRYREAEKALMETHEIYSRIGSDIGAANALHYLGNTYGSQSRNREAEKAFMEAYEIHSRIGHDMGVANALNGLGAVYYARSRYQEAEKTFMEAHEIHSRIGNGLGAANALSGLGEINHTQSRYREAEKALIEAHEIYSRIGNDRWAANALIGLGEIYRVQSRYREAEKASLQARETHSHMGHDLGLANALLVLGNTYLDQRRNAEAKNTLSDAHKIYSRIGHSLGTANALQSLEVLHSNQNRYDAAQASLLALGKDYHAQRRYSDAEEAVRNALAIWISTAGEEGQIAALLHLAHIFQSQSRHNEEKEALIQAEYVLARLGCDGARAATLHRIGDIHRAQTAYDEAEECYRIAQAIFSRMNDIRGEAAEVFSLGVLYSDQHRRDEAEKCFAEAHVAYARIVDKDGEAKALNGLVGVQRKFNAARAACVEARRIYKQMGRPMRAICAAIWERRQAWKQSV